MSSSLLSISSIMHVILPACSGWNLAMARKSSSPSILLWAPGGAAAKAAAVSGAPGPASNFVVVGGVRGVEALCADEAPRKAPPPGVARVVGRVGSPPP